MCRLLLVRKEEEFSITPHLEKFAELSRKSKEFQGHGWGCSWLEDNEWKHYKNINPIWEDDLSQFGKTRQLIAHARSAFQDKGIEVENNMPFYDENYVYIFNGELRGVKIKEEGRIGAEKIFNFIKRFDKGNILEALKKGISIVKKRTEYVRAINVIISDKEKAYVANVYNEDPDYFTMYYKEKDGIMICSDPYPGEEWIPLEQGSIIDF